MLARRIGYTLLIGCFHFILNGQSRPITLGAIPEITGSHKLTSNWSVTGKIESRHAAFAQQSNGDATGYSYVRTDVQLLGGYRINPFLGAAIGYQSILHADGPMAHRATQQLSVVLPYPGYRFAHRFRTDQTWQQDDTPRFRLRYRFSLELPLQGLEVDPNEWYVVFSDEPVLDYQRSLFFENRIGTIVGYVFTSGNKLETGLDYRLERIGTAVFGHEVWFKLNWFTSW